MPEELIETVEEEVDDVDQEDILEEAVQDSLVIRVHIDDTLSISGDAADAKAVGDALANKASVSDIKQTLNVNGRTGNGSWGITVNGDNIPAQSDSDAESVADALSRIDGAVGDLEDDLSDEATARDNADTALGTRIGTEETARANADTALEGRLTTQLGITNQGLEFLNTRLLITDEPKIAALEAHEGFSVVLSFTEAGSQSVTDSMITANHMLTGFQFFDSDDYAVGNVLADLTWLTSAGTLNVTLTNIYAPGSVRLDFGWRADATLEEVGS